jgi:hypothetical protein
MYVLVFAWCLGGRLERAPRSFEQRDDRAFVGAEAGPHPSL